LGLLVETKKPEIEGMPEEITHAINKLIKKRTHAREEKKYAEADALRKEIEILLQPFHAELIDQPDGLSVVVTKG
jgi:cysteinyl-tRNA synthetase